MEFLCNECCWFGCKDRKRCYETVSRKNLGENCPEHHCAAPDAEEGYRFSKAMKNPGFIRIEDIQNVYLPMGFSNFKIEGRDLAVHWCWNFCFTIWLSRNIRYISEKQYILIICWICFRTFFTLSMFASLFFFYNNFTKVIQKHDSGLFFLHKILISSGAKEQKSRNLI